MDGRKFDWIRKQLGLFKVQSGSSLYRIKVSSGASGMGAATVALAIFGLRYQDRIGGLLEELSEPEEEMTRKANGSQGNRGAKKSGNFCCQCTYRIHIVI